MIDEQDAQILKSQNDYAGKKRKPVQYLKCAEIWQSASVTCLYAALDFVSPPEKAQENHIVEEEDSTIYTHLEKKRCLYT